MASESQEVSEVTESCGAWREGGRAEVASSECCPVAYAEADSLCAEVAFTPCVGRKWNLGSVSSDGPPMRLREGSWGERSESVSQGTSGSDLLIVEVLRCRCGASGDGGITLTGSADTLSAVERLARDGLVRAV